MDRETDTDYKPFAQVITIGKNKDRNTWFFSACCFDFFWCFFRLL